MSVRRLGSLLSFCIAAGCGIVDADPTPRDRFEVALQEWTGHDITHYEFVFQISECECLPRLTGPWLVEIDGDHVRKVSDARTGVATSESPYVRTIAQLFEMIEDALDRRSPVLIVEYHPDLGHPTRISIDYDRQIADDEFTIRARDLRALP